MRPSRLSLLIAVGLVLITCAITLAQPEGGAMVQWLWALFGLAATVDLVISRKGRSVAALLDLPDQMFVGTTADVPLTLRSATGPLPRDLRVQAQTRGALDTTIPDVDITEDTAELTLTLTCSARGAFAFERLWLMWPSRLGLFDIITAKGFDHAIDGVPNIQPVLSGQITTQVQAELYGVKDSQFRGEGSEFHQLRDFTTGMDTRLIDWKRSARHGSLVARETHVEQNHQIIMCVDNGHLMRQTIDGLPKIDCALNAALATTWAAGIGGDQVGFMAFDSRPGLYIPPAPGRTAFARIRGQVAGLAYKSVESNHTLALAHLNGLLNRRSLIIVFTDFVDRITAQLMVENLAVLSRHHVLVVVTLKDPVLEQTAAPSDSSMAAIAKSVAAQEMSKERQMVLDELRRMGVVCLDVAPGSLSPELVSTYIDIKAREMI